MSPTKKRVSRDWGPIRGPLVIFGALGLVWISAANVAPYAKGLCSPSNSYRTLSKLLMCATVCEFRVAFSYVSGTNSCQVPR